MNHDYIHTNLTLFCLILLSLKTRFGLSQCTTNPKYFHLTDISYSPWDFLTKLALLFMRLFTFSTFDHYIQRMNYQFF